MAGRLDRNWAIIIGSMKSGTTTLFEHLSGHPAIAPCRIKEPNFFTDEERWSRGLEWYRGLFDWDPTVHRWALEASTAYSKCPAVENPAKRIASLPGEKRLIYIMRDPVERIRSQISYGKAKKWPTFTEMEDRIPSKAIEISRYACQLEPYRRTLGLDCLKLLFFEDLVENPQRVVKDVCAFLELSPPIDPVTGNAYNVTTELLVSPGWYERIRNAPIIRCARALAPTRKWVGRLLPGFRTAERFEMTEDQRRRVLEDLKDDLAKLEGEYGVDVSRWGYDVS